VGVIMMVVVSVVMVVTVISTGRTRSVVIDEIGKPTSVVLRIAK